MSKLTTRLRAPLQQPASQLSSRTNTSSSLFLNNRCTFSTSTQLRSDSARPTVLTASRIFPYPTYAIFKVIADINSYPKFLPYVRAAEVKAESARLDGHHNERWPALASLTVGFQDTIAETYTSRVFCVPPAPHKGRAGIGFVEALSGSEAPKPTFTAEEDVSHYDDIGEEMPVEATKGPLAFLRTRWTVSAYPHKPAPGSADKTHGTNLEPGLKAQEHTKVNLAVEFRFQNPVYEALSQAASGKVANIMIEAFEKRVQEVL